MAVIELAESIEQERQEPRLRAISNLEKSLQKPEETYLREHQINMLQALLEFLKSGESTGYLSEPTGVGKSAVLVKAAEAMGLKTVILSPTQQILDQNFDAARKFTPELKITNVDARSQDFSGRVINTTYQSVHSILKERGEGQITRGRHVFRPEDVELLLCDEAHTGLGEKRHAIYRDFPNAILIGLTATPDFQQLEGFIGRGIVKKDEPWAGMFRNNIHEMTLEEAIEREILVNLNVHLLKTNTVVKDIKILSNDEYRQSDIEKYFATKSRDALAIGAIVGSHAVPKDVNLASLQKKEIEAIHEKIKGKRTVVFGISIEHIEKLAKELRSQGISAAAVHSETDPGKRTQILKAHANGEIQVVLGVDMLRLGWDSPPTEVGIYLRPTHSGIVKIQELGRILRPSQETGKEKAIAVEFVDSMVDPMQAPVLIANIFDPEYILRGSQTGREPSSVIEKTSKDKPKITFSGIDVDAIVEEARSQEMLRKRFKQVTVAEMSELLDEIIAEITETNTNMEFFDLCKELANILPGKLPNEVNQGVLQAVANIDVNTRKLGEKAIIYLNLKTILTVVDGFANIEKENKEELLMVAILGVIENINRIKPYFGISQQIHHAARRGIVRYIATRDKIPVGIVEHPDFPIILSSVNKALTERGALSKEEVEKLANELSEKTGIHTRNLIRYIKNKKIIIGFNDLRKKETLQEDNVVDTVIKKSLSETINDVLGSLTERQRRVIKLRFGLEEGEGKKTFEEVGKGMGVTGATARQIQEKALRELRHPKRSRRFVDYLEE